MGKQEYLNSVRSAMINISNRNCNLADLGYVTSDESLVQLQFLSLLEQCFKRIEIFNAEQLNNLDNMLSYVLNMSPIDGDEYDTSKIISVMNDEQMIIATTSKEVAILNEICKWYCFYGGSTLKECNASCEDYNKSAVALYNMFSSALCAKAINQIKLYDTLIKYIVAKLAKQGFKIDVIE